MAPNGRDGRLHGVGKRRGVETAVPAVIALRLALLRRYVSFKAVVGKADPPGRHYDYHSQHVEPRLSPVHATRKPHAGP